MSPEEREARIEAAAQAIYRWRFDDSSGPLEGRPKWIHRACSAEAVAVLDAADKAVPVVSEAQVITHVGGIALIDEALQQRAERAEAEAQYLREQNDGLTLAVQMVSNAQEHAEAAARDFAEQLAAIERMCEGSWRHQQIGDMAARILALHPSYTTDQGENG